MGKISTMLALDGETQFRRQLNLINQNLKTLDKELQTISSEFTVTGSKMQQSMATTANYSKQIELLTAKENMLKTAIANAESEVEKNSKKVSNSRQAYENATKGIHNAKKEIEVYTRVFGENSSAVDRAKQRLKQFETEQKNATKELNTAEKQMYSAANQVQRYKQQLADTRTAINRCTDAQRNLNKETQTSQKQLSQMSGYIANSVINAAKKFSELGSVLGKVAGAGVKTLETSLKAVTTELSLGTKGFEAYISAIAAAGTAVVTFASKNGMSFEASMSKVEAYSGVTKDEMAQLTEAAKEVGATTSKTATEAADALGYLALNGYKTDEMLKTITPIVKASEAGTMDLATTANLTARALTAYGKSAEDAEDFLNILTATQNNSSTSLNDLLTAYADMAGTFRSLNIGFEESATILGVFANQGTSGAQAATALSSVMLRLVGSNKKAAAALSEVGVEAWDDEGNFRGLTTVLKELGTALEDATMEQETLIESQIGGVMRIQELKKLIAGVMDTEQFEKVAEPINNAIANQTMYSTAETMMDNLKGKVTLLQSAMSALGTSIYETFSDDAGLGVDQITAWANMFDEAVKSADVKKMFGAENKFKDQMIEYIKKGYEQITKSEELFRIINLGIRNIIKIGLAGITESKEAIPFVMEFFENLIQNVSMNIINNADELEDIANTFYTELLNAINKAADFLIDQEAFDKLVDVLCTGILDALEIFELGASIIGKIAEEITKEENLEKIIGTGLTVVNTLADDIGDNFPTILDKAGEIIEKFVEGIKEEETLEHLVDAAVTIVASLAEFLDENIESIIDEADDIIDRIAEQLITDENLKKLEESGTNLLKALFKGFLKLGDWSWSGAEENYARNKEKLDNAEKYYRDLGVSAESVLRDYDYVYDFAKQKSSFNDQNSSNVNVTVDMSGTVINGYSDMETIMSDITAATEAAVRAKGRR